MLQNIRDNSQGWIAKTIIGIIIILLALTGVDALFTASADRSGVVEVNGEPITEAELGQAVAMQRNQLLQQLGSDFDPSQLNEALLREAALKNLIERTLLLQGAREADFAFSSAALDQVILQTPEFQVDGKFDANRFDQVIQRLGYSRAQFRQMLEQELLIGQLQAGIAGTAFVTDAQVDAFIRLEQQTRDFQQLLIDADPSTVVVGDEEVEAFYEANAERYRSPEQVGIDYVTLDKASFFDQVEVDEQAIEDLYQKQVAGLAEQRRAAHILIEVDEQTDDAAAKGKVEALRQRIEQGEDFAALAREASQDPGSASEGGDLGFAGPGVYDEAFEEALYALEQGAVSPPVRSEYGWHLIKLLDTQSPEVPALEAMRPELERQLKAEQVEQRFVEVSKQLEAAAYESPDLVQPAQELGLEVRSLPPFGREGGEGIASNRQVLQAAFSEPVLVEGLNSSLIELDPETVVVLRVREHLKPERLPLEQVRDEIAQNLRREKASQQAQVAGETLIGRLRAGEALPEAAADAGWRTFEAAGRNHEGVEPEVLQEVFRMAKPAQEGQPTYAGVSLSGGDYVVLRLEGVNEPEAQQALSEEMRNNYRRFLASRAGRQDFSAYVNHLRETAEIERQ